MRTLVAPRRRGFTLIELLVVMAIIATLLSLVSPRYFRSIDTAREAVLHENLSAIRDAIDKFYGDTGRYPADLQQLVDQRYLRQLPLDPVTDSTATWLLVPPATGSGVYDVHSGAPGLASTGVAFSEW